MNTSSPWAAVTLTCPQQIRAELRNMTDDELEKFAKDASDACGSEPDISGKYVMQLQEAIAEWGRRKTPKKALPKATHETAVRLNLGKLREELQKMTDEKLLKYGRVMSQSCEAAFEKGRSPKPEDIIRLAEAAEEWKRRRPKTTQT